MTETLRPETPEHVLDLVTWALDGGRALDISGTGSKAGFGRPVEAEQRLQLAALTGITLYEPAELVLARPGRDAARRDRDRAASPPPATCLRAGGSGRALGRSRHPRQRGREHRRRRCLQPGGSAAHQGGGGARPRTRLPRRERPRRGVQVGGARGQERDRLRPLEADRRLVRHPRRAHRCHPQGGPGAGGDADRPRPRGVRVRRRYRHVPRARQRRRCLRRRPLAAIRGRGFGSDGRRRRRVSGDGAPARGHPAVGGCSTGGPDPASPRVRRGGGARREPSLALWREIRDVSFFAARSDHTNCEQVWRLSVSPTAGASVAAAVLDATGARVLRLGRRPRMVGDGTP